MSALAALDRLIADLGTLPVFRGSGGVSSSSPSSSSSSSSASSSHSLGSNKQVSRLLGLITPFDVRAELTDENIWAETPDVIQDVAWFPVVPPGHLPFTWGIDSTDVSYRAAAPVASHTSTASTPAAAAAPAKAEEKKQEKPATTGAPAGKEQKPKQDKPAKEKKEQKAAAPAPAAANSDLPPIARLDIRVGRIVRAWKHPDADSLYVEEIDVGEEKPRQVVSGLVKYISEDKMQGARCLVICNLKPSKLRNQTSFGMVLAAANADRSVIELVAAPASAAPGERVTFKGLEVPADATPDKEVNPQSKQNAWELAKGDLKTNGSNVAVWRGHELVTASGPCQSASLANATVS